MSNRAGRRRDLARVILARMLLRVARAAAEAANGLMNGGESRH